MSWKDNFKKGKEIILSTSSEKYGPHSNIVISLGFVDGKLLVADCQMKTTINNMRKNRKVCVVGKYTRIKGTSEIFSKGKYFEMCNKQSDKYKAKHAILISIDEVFDLDKVKKIE